MIFKRNEFTPPPLVLPEPIFHEVRALINAHRKINAIKLIREVTHSGLKEAKDLADAIEHGYQPPSPQPFVPPQFVPPQFAPGPAAAEPSLADRARAFRDSGDPDRAAALVQAETGMTREESLAFLAALR